MTMSQMAEGRSSNRPYATVNEAGQLRSSARCSGIPWETRVELRQGEKLRWMEDSSPYSAADFVDEPSLLEATSLFL